jgi:hypothetical protein
MGEQHDNDWVRTLGEVQDAIRGCLAALDRYEAKFAGLLGEAAHCLVAQASTPVRLGTGVDACATNPLQPNRSWRDRLTAARTEADEADHLLAEQEAVWGRWLGAFAAWRRSLEQTP